MKISPSILLLVSDPVVRTVLQELLENHGYCVISASNLGSAVDRLKTVRPDLLMIRSYVSDMPGHQAAIYLRKLAPGIPVIMVGGQMDDNRLTSRNAIERFYVFPRPFSPADLLRDVDEILKPLGIPVPEATTSSR